MKTDVVRITPDVLLLIAKIDEFKGAWRALGALAPERLVIMRSVTISDVMSLAGANPAHSSSIFWHW